MLITSAEETTTAEATYELSAPITTVVSRLGKVSHDSENCEHEGIDLPKDIPEPDNTSDSA